MSSASITLIPEPLLDPRGTLLVEPALLAPRPASLHGKFVLLLDNTQLAVRRPIFGPVFSWLSAGLARSHGAACSEKSLDLLVGGKERLGALVDELASMHVDAVVIAICHGGVTQPSTLFSAALERRGIPCVLLCSELGFPLAAATAATYVPGLPLVLLRPASGSDAGEGFGQPEADAVAPRVVAALTLPHAQLAQRFTDSLPKKAGGRIELAPRTAARASGGNGGAVTLDPGCFASDLYEKLCADRLGDGFPVIPPTAERVRAMLRHTNLDADFALVRECPPSGAAITVEALAVNAVMAGCKPEYFPILVAALQAMADPAYRLFQGAITTHPGGNAVIVSGPLARQLGIESGPGCLGPGFRANATIGRAVNLTVMNVARAVPGQSDLGVFGSAAEFTYCVAENCEANPWSPLHADLYGPDVTSVTVHKCEGPHNVAVAQSERPEALLRFIASTAATLGGNNMTLLGQLVVFLNPGHARLIADFNWTKRDVQEYLFDIARHPIEDVLPELPRISNFPAHFLSLRRVPVMRSPEDVIVVVCGGMGRHSMVAIPWGLSSAVSRPVVPAILSH